MIHQRERRLRAGLDTLCQEASSAIEEGCNILILSDKGVDANHVPIPSLLATSAVHHPLIRKGTRTKIGLVIESGEPREVYHFALLVGYGAGAIHPYLALQTARKLVIDGEIDGVQLQCRGQFYQGQ
ncbi:MAG: hypothetical protein Ct9H300mP27_09790 [Chloroflexota bacterium]|nr:MAG: hypothetical protein Ct9H300mP27_09790 [Chloroflexota bacterium]